MRYTPTSCTPLPGTLSLCTLLPCTATPPSSVAGPTFAPALPHRSRAHPNRVHSWPASRLAYTARVPQPQLHSHARASTASLKPAPALPRQSSSACAPPRRELRSSTAWPACRSCICATPPARAASTSAPAAAGCLLPRALQRLPRPSRAAPHCTCSRAPARRRRSAPRPARATAPPRSRAPAPLQHLLTLPSARSAPPTRLLVPHQPSRPPRLGSRACTPASHPWPRRARTCLRRSRRRSALAPAAAALAELHGGGERERGKKAGEESPWNRRERGAAG
jgi:hypothetical protein